MTRKQFSCLAEHLPNSSLLSLLGAAERSIKRRHENHQVYGRNATGIVLDHLLHHSSLRAWTLALMSDKAHNDPLQVNGYSGLGMLFGI